MWCSSINTACALKFSQFAIRLLIACKDWNDDQICSHCFKLFPRILLSSIFPTVSILLQCVLFHIKHASCPFGLFCFKWKYDQFFTMYSIKTFYFGFHIFYASIKSLFILDFTMSLILMNWCQDNDSIELWTLVRFCLCLISLTKMNC